MSAFFLLDPVPSKYLRLSATRSQASPTGSSPFKDHPAYRIRLWDTCQGTKQLQSLMPIPASRRTLTLVTKSSQRQSMILYKQFKIVHIAGFAGSDTSIFSTILQDGDNQGLRELDFCSSAKVDQSLRLKGIQFTDYAILRSLLTPGKVAPRCLQSKQSLHKQSLMARDLGSRPKGKQIPESQSLSRRPLV